MVVTFGERKKMVLIPVAHRFPWCEYSHHGQCQGKNLQPLNRNWEEIVKSHFCECLCKLLYQPPLPSCMIFGGFWDVLFLLMSTLAK